MKINSSVINLGSKGCVLTRCKEDGEREAHEDDVGGVEHDEDEEEAGVGVLVDGATLEVDENEDCYDNVDDANKQEILEEPGEPLQPVVHAHQLQRFL